MSILSIPKYKQYIFDIILPETEKLLIEKGEAYVI